MDTTEVIASLSTERRPDWRLQLACEDAKSRRLSLPPRADDETRRAAMYLAEMIAADVREHDELRRRPRFRDYATVLEWYYDRDKGAQIEAFVLGRMSSEFIANQLSLTPVGIDRYRTLCFDVTAKLNEPSYIVRHAIVGERRTGNPATGQRRLTMKLLAYYYGPQILFDLYAIRPAEDVWSRPVTDIRRHQALAELDRLVDLFFNRGANGTPLSASALEDFIASIEPYLSANYSATRKGWIMRYSASKGPPNTPPQSPSIDSRGPSAAKVKSVRQKPLKPTAVRVQELRDQARRLRSDFHKYTEGGFDLGFLIAAARLEEVAEELIALERHEKQLSNARIVRESFIRTLTTPAAVPSQSPDGPGIDPSWNLNVYDYRSDADIAAWARQQIEEQDGDVLVASGLFIKDEDRVRLADEIAARAAPIVVTRRCQDEPASSVFVGEWTRASVNPLSEFVGDFSILQLVCRTSGVFIASSTSREVAAWRRLGVAAVPLPTESIWPAVGDEYWKTLARVCGPPAHEECPSASATGQSPPQLSAVLAISSLDPETLCLRDAGDFRSMQEALRRRWETHCHDPRISVGYWAPSSATIDDLQESIRVSCCPLIRAGYIKDCFKKELRWLIPGSRKPQPPSDLAGCRQALAALDPEASIEQTEARFRQFTQRYEIEVVEPLLSDATLAKSPLDRVSVNVIADLMRQQAQIGGALTIPAAGSNVDQRTTAALRREYCRNAKVLFDAIKTVKGARRGRYR